MLKILLALLFLLPSQGWCTTQWNTAIPAAGDSKSAWPAAVHSQWSIQDTLLSNYRRGMSVAYSSASALTVSAGECTVSNSGGTTRLFLQNAANTSVTSSNLDTGASFSASTTYYVYAGTSSTTAASATYYVSLSGTAPSGVTYYLLLGSFTTNGSGNIILSQVYANPYTAVTSTSTGEIPNLTIRDYGTSTSAYTTRSPLSYYFIHGEGTQTSGSMTISGLPFTSSTSYAISCTRLNTGGYASQAIDVTAKSASSFTCADNLGSALPVDWMAIGY